MTAQSQRRNNIRPAFEPLEARDNPAGAVTAFVSNNELFVFGDGDPAGNKVKVTQDGAGNVFVLGIDGTTVNGQAGVYVGTGAPNRISMQLGGAGADFAEVSNISAGRIDIFTGDGADTVYLNNVLAGSVYVDSGGGNDGVIPNGLQTQFGATFVGGTGFDTVYYGPVGGPTNYQQFEQALPF